MAMSAPALTELAEEQASTCCKRKRIGDDPANQTLRKTHPEVYGSSHELIHLGAALMEMHQRVITAIRHENMDPEPAESERILGLLEKELRIHRRWLRNQIR